MPAMIPGIVLSLPTQETVEMISACCPATVFYREDGSALIMADDQEWVALVDPYGCVDTAYTSQLPAECLSTADGDDDPSHITGFRSGWEC